MKRRLIRAIKSESGQALPIVLVLLLLGGLLVAPSLSYASTSLNVGQIVEKNVKGLYAADAGVEDALWCIKNSVSPHTQLNVNQMPVDIRTDIIGIYALYFGDIIVVDERPQGQEHYKWLTVAGQFGDWIEEKDAYEYTITVTWQPKEGEEGGGDCNLYEIGVRLPVGYSYVLDSAADPSFADNLSIEEPVDTLDEADAHMLNWAIPTGDPPELSYLNPTRTQTFYITGEGSQDGDYTWVGAVRQDVGQVGEVIGGLYRITATATRPGDVDPTAIVTADAMWNEGTGEVTIILWQINPQ